MTGAKVEFAAGEAATTAAPATLILVRHGETVWNHDSRVQGQTDIPLNATGRQQAVALGRSLSRRHLDAVYSSDLSRASETALLCLQGRELAIRPDPRLRERHYGAWEGLQRHEIMVLPGEPLAATIPGALDRAPDGGESWDDLLARVGAALREIAAAHAGQTVLIVGHGGTLRAAFCSLLGLPGSVRRMLTTDNACLCEFRVGGAGPRLISWNDTHHLVQDVV